MEIVAVDIGGTHARFAIATLKEGSVSLGPETVLRTSDYASLAEAWKAFGAGVGRALPSRAGIAIAAPVEGAAIKLTNNAWVLRPATLASELGVASVSLVNDFAAVAHAVSACADQHKHLCGPDQLLPRSGVVSIVGPGTGLGVAILRRRPDGDEVIPTEGGHIGFAPADEVDERILARFRVSMGRVSAERVVSGSGLPDIYAAVTGDETPREERALWRRALAGDDAEASAALDRFCGLLGGVAGDLALAQGARAVVIAGGLGLRLAPHLPGSSFAARFVAKGRFKTRMEQLPVKLITHPQPGLLGAAAAFAAEHRG
jgi:glucokinase